MNEQQSSNERACCSHLHVSYLTSTVEGLTRGWWACDDCDAKFTPTALAQHQIERLTRERDQYQQWWEEHGQTIDRLRAALELAEQALREVAGAQERGANWWTKGEPAMYQHIRMWVLKGLEAAREALRGADKTT